MGGKYEIRYFDIYNSENGYFTTIYTDSFMKFLKLRLTKRLIYYKINF